MALFVPVDGVCWAVVCVVKKSHGLRQLGGKKKFDCFMPGFSNPELVTSYHCKGSLMNQY